MDPHPSKLETNLDTLLSQMGALKQLKREAQRKGGRKTMKSWLQNVEAKEHELDQIQRELEQLKTLGLHRDKFYVRHNLNKRVIECLSVVEALKAPENTKKVSRDNGNCMEMWISELEMLKPQRYSYDQLINIITADVIIGQGGFGEVYKGKICKVEVAVKVLKEHEDKIMEKQFMNEMRTMFSTSHQHLVKFYGYCFEPEKKALIYEYTENGSLDKHLYKKRGGLPWDTLYNIAIGTAKGIAHLHESDEKPIIHYDIKAANVLLDSNYSPKVTDFGLSKMYEKDVSHVIQSGIGGTTLYAAPEVSLRNKEITFKCDVFSFGLMLLEILRRKRITKNENCWFPLKVWESLQNGMLENLLLNCGIEKKDTKQAERFAIAGLWCVQFQPKDRPHMSDVVKVLQGVMQLPSDPPNPDTSSMFASAHGTAHERATSAGSYVYDERSTVDDDDDDDDDDEEEEEEEEEDPSNFVVAGSYVYDERDDDDDGGGGGMFGSAYGAAPERATLDGAYFYDERSDDDDDEDADESLRKPKYASTSNLNNPVKPKRNAVVDFAKTLRELFKKTKPQPIYDGDTIRNATKDFSDANKLGEGGFGAVYKGELLDGPDIAVKILSKNLAQGSKNFKNEVVLIQKLQHPNLVRLLGFTLSGEKKLLIYEYFPNGSLDKYIFDTTKNSSLDWERRYKIVGGIAQGLRYLHGNSILQIIHRNLKAGNILLDKEMNPKIADFGMAKLFVTDQTQTFEYMAGEYAMQGLFSLKSDVYSFGVLLLEIVSGKKASDMHISTHSRDLLSYAWNLWRADEPLKLMDPILRESFSEIQVMRCIHIGLLCVQDNSNDRPTMPSVCLFLEYNSLEMKSPTPPSFLSDRSF